MGVPKVKGRIRAVTLAFCCTVLLAESINAPAFREYPVLEGLSVKRSEPDLASHPLARQYRTTIRKAAARDPDFAGHYVVAWWGCGNECQQSLILDLNTGKAYGIAGTNRPLETSRGISTRVDSKLLIADPPCDEGQSCLSEGRRNLPVRYYVLENGGLRLIKEMPCQVVKGTECK